MTRGDDLVFGEIPGYPEGSAFGSRTELLAAGLHRRSQHGISGLAGLGADAIVLNGGYPTDEDRGAVVIYTGEGGFDFQQRKFVRDQEFVAGNQALADSEVNDLPVRVIRGETDNKALRPPNGYRYDGLYRVVWTRREPSPDGPLICRYRLEKLDLDATEIEAVDAAAAPTPPTPAPGTTAPHVPSAGSRLVRRAQLATWVKSLYGHRCQICGERIELPGSAFYAECAHIHPLGLPHNGPDDPGNVLCLCPNDHVRLDRGVISLSPTLEVIDCATRTPVGTLTLDKSHALLVSAVTYHRELWMP